MTSTPRSRIFRNLWSNSSVKSKPNSKILYPINQGPRWVRITDKITLQRITPIPRWRWRSRWTTGWMTTLGSQGSGLMPLNPTDCEDSLCYPKGNLITPEVNIQPLEVNIQSREVNIQPPVVNIQPLVINIQPLEVNIQSPEVNIQPPVVNIKPPNPEVILHPPQCQREVS